MPASMRLIVSADRGELGILELRDSTGLVRLRRYAVARAYQPHAAAAGNSERSTLLPFGDTPLGGYEFSPPQATGTAQHPADKYGPNGFFRLTPRSYPLHDHRPCTTRVDALARRSGVLFPMDRPDVAVVRGDRVLSEVTATGAAGS
jgi:hypothetical protein